MDSCRWDDEHFRSVYAFKECYRSKVYSFKRRRNNLATNGCEGLLVDDCDIEEAGGDTIGPQLGIDLEGFGENGIKYDHPYKLTVRNCRFKNNGRGSRYSPHKR